MTQAHRCSAQVGHSSSQPVQISRDNCLTPPAKVLCEKARHGHVKHPTSAPTLHILDSITTRGAHLINATTASYNTHPITAAAAASSSLTDQDGNRRRDSYEKQPVPESGALDGATPLSRDDRQFCLLANLGCRNVRII